MIYFIPKYLTLLSVIFSVSLCAPFIRKGEIQTDKIKLPKAFKIEVYATGLNDVRAMVLGDNGTVFAGSFGAGNIYALVDTDNDFKADKTYTIAKGLESPVGVAFKNGSLYFSEISQISRIDDIEENLENPGEPVVIYDQFPDETHHGWKFIDFGPDGKLYVPVGAPCNICESEEIIFATITRMNPDGSNHEIFVEGVRNSVGFDWHPETNEMWFTDNGRDWLGDNNPPDELNRVHQKGNHFGYPYCHGNNISDPEFGEKRTCSEFISPVMELGPHVAALGMHFYTGQMFPKEYSNKIFIAEHGSWNRSTPIGYRITTVEYNETSGLNYEVFAEGWLQGNAAWGRPVDVLQLPDGSLLVSDDHAGAIYRIYYEPT